MASESQDSGVHEKKVVVHIVRGRLAGLRRIIGRVVLDADHQYPPVIPFLDGQAHHAGTYPRYVMYREWSPAKKGSLNEFHPEQK